MKPNEFFLKQPKHFWANVRTISEESGYTAKQPKKKQRRKKKDNQVELIEVSEQGGSEQVAKGKVHVPSVTEMQTALHSVGLSSAHIVCEHGEPTELGLTLSGYFEHRARVLNEFVEPRLMTKEQARQTFYDLKERLCPKCPIPMNRQKGEKRTEAYFTGIINMIIEANSDGFPVNYDPQGLTSITLNGAPLRTLARRVDGVFTSTVNPIALWEIKEYYNTTSFGSRVADGVYESLLDGMELEELREHEGVEIKHYLMIDAYETWWKMGKSYLCRIIDMLHMGYVDEVIFGSEALERLPDIVKEWVEVARQRLLKTCRQRET